MEKLLNKLNSNYVAKVEEFNKTLNNENRSKILQNLYNSSLINTKLSYKILGLLMDGAGNAANYSQKSVKKSLKELDDLSESITESENSLILFNDKELIKARKDSINVCKESYNQAIETKKTICRVDKDFILGNLKTSITSLNEVLTSQSSEESFDAILKFIKFILGLTPVYGSIFSGLDSIKEIIEKKKKESNITDKNLYNLEAYNISIMQWSLSSLLISMQFNNMENSIKLDIDESLKKLKEHRIAIIQG